MNELSLMARASRTGTAIDDIDSLIEWTLMNTDCCVFFPSDPIQGGEKREEEDTSVASSASGINQT